jgi:hypothetical protein
MAAIAPKLCDLMVQIANALRTYPEGSVERQNAITNLRNIARMVPPQRFGVILRHAPSPVAALHRRG